MMKLWWDSGLANQQTLILQLAAFIGCLVNLPSFLLPWPLQLNLVFLGPDQPLKF